jgi:hypothetical protein
MCQIEWEDAYGEAGIPFCDGPSLQAAHYGCGVGGGAWKGRFQYSKTARVLSNISCSERSARSATRFRANRLSGKSRNSLATSPRAAGQPGWPIQRASNWGYRPGREAQWEGGLAAGCGSAPVCRAATPPPGCWGSSVACAESMHVQEKSTQALAPKSLPPAPRIRVVCLHGPGQRVVTLPILTQVGHGEHPYGNHFFSFHVLLPAVPGAWGLPKFPRAVAF